MQVAQVLFILAVVAAVFSSIQPVAGRFRLGWVSVALLAAGLAVYVG